MAETEVLISLFHTPGPALRRVFHTVMRAGHLKAGPDYRIERQSCPGHDLLFCLRGSGFVRNPRQTFAVAPSQVAWVDGRYPHAHWADPSRPWELLWIRFSSPQIDDLCTILSVDQWPVFPVATPASLRRRFQNILRLLATPDPPVEARLHAEVAAMVAALFVARAERWEPREASVLTAQLEPVFTQMRLNFHRPWRVSELARLAGMSEPHFFRRFRQATGSSPIDWLRRERISQAKRRLIESRDTIQEVAGQAGYADAFYFSRDFRRCTGMTPTEFRRAEGVGS